MIKKVTIKEVAEIAGVSKTTISRFLNGQYGNMSADTKRRIARVIEELNYRPSKQAQALKSKRSYLIGVVVADISNMYSSLLLKGVGDILAKRGYQMIIVDSANSLEREKNLLTELLDQEVEGIILQPCSCEAANYQFILDKKIPLLLVDRQIEPTKCPTVVTNNVAAIEMVMNEVFKKDYQKIIVISEPLSEVTTRKVRFETVKKMTQENQRSIELIEVSPMTDLKKLVLQEVNNNEKTLLFASNGRVLMDLLTILAEEKIAIPKQIGITGFDDWKITALVGPGITSIEQQSQEIGEVAAKKILDCLKNGKFSRDETIVPSKLRWRHSL